MVGLTLLIVDDSAVMRALVKRALAVAGVTVETVLDAANGREALAVLETHRVDVLVTDLNMPEMSGLELLQQIRARGSWPDLVCAVFSSDGSDSRRAEMRQLGVEVFLRKPFRPDVMRDVVNVLNAHCRAGAR